MSQTPKTKILICGILPPPSFGHSMMYKMLMDSAFVDEFDITFLDLKFWSYGKHKKVTILKLLKMVKYLFQYIYLLIIKRPKYVLYNMSFYKMPFLKDFVFCLVGKILGAKIIIQDFGQYIQELHDNSGRFIRWILRQYMKITTASIIMGEHTRAVYEGFLKSEQLYVVPGCVEDTGELFKEKEIKQFDYTNVLYFSFISELKGAKVAFDAVRQILSKRNDIGFTFAGPLESEEIGETIDCLVQEFPERVRYLGYIDDVGERTKLFREADIFIFPTLRDVFGLVLLHALAENVAIVASREGNVPDIVEDNVNGLLFDKGNAGQLAEKIMHLADNTDIRLSLGKDNRQKYLKEYNLEAYGRKMIEVLKSLESQ